MTLEERVVPNPLTVEYKVGVFLTMVYESGKSGAQYRPKHALKSILEIIEKEKQESWQKGFDAGLKENNRDLDWHKGTV